MIANYGGQKNILTHDLVAFTAGDPTVAHEELTSIVYGGGVFVAGSAVISKIYSSIDGINWSVIAGLSGLVCYNVKYVNKKFFALGYKNNGSEDHVAVFMSTDAVTWTDVSPASGNTAAPGYCRDIDILNGTYCLVCNDGIYYCTTLGTWTYVAMSFGCRKLATDNNIVIVGGVDRLSWSSDLINWNDVVVSGTVVHMVYGQETFIAATVRRIFTSADGLVWETEVDLLGLDPSGLFLAHYTDKFNVEQNVVYLVNPLFDNWLRTENDGSYSWSGTSHTYAWQIKCACAVDCESDVPGNVLNSGVHIVAILGSIENLANDALTGFTGELSAYAKLSVPGKLLQWTNLYKSQVLAVQLDFEVLSGIHGVAVPNPHPSLQTDIYGKINETYRHMEYLSNFIELYASLPDPSSEHLVNAVAAYSDDLKQKFDAALETAIKLKANLDMWLQELVA